MTGLARGPKLRIRSVRARSALFAFYLLSVVLYLGWRLTTFNFDFPAWSVVFFLAELVSIVNSIVFYMLIVKRADRPEPAPADPPSTVDVLIMTYNEEVELVRTTAVAARDMDGTHRTWICDDGRRPAIESLARELGVGYLSRPKNDHYKAGNINHALKHTRGDLVMVLDADHVARRPMLARLLPHFSDPKVALVQTPQVFYNIDSFQHAASIRRRHLWHEASVFHHMMQPGADRLNASFFIGTGAVLRRSALEEVGGIATGSITEDIWTAMRMHARGYRSVYVDEALGFLLAPDTPFAYARQRLRWAQGNMQILRRENPLLATGLSFWQRVCYLVFLGGYLASFQHLVFYLAPGIFLCGRMSPIAADPRIAVPVLAARVLIDLATFKLLASPYARIFFSECFKLLNAAIYIRGAAALVNPRALPFQVTPKGKHGGLPLALVLPAAILSLFNLTAIGIGVSRLLRGDPAVGAIALSLFFAVQFGLVGAFSLLFAYERRRIEDSFAFPVSIGSAFVVMSPEATGPAGPITGATIHRVNRDTAYAGVRERIPTGTFLQIDLREAGLTRPLAAKVEGAQPLEGRPGLGYILKLALLDVTPREGDSLDRFVFNTALPRFFAEFVDSPPAPPPDDPPLAAAGRRLTESGIREFFHVRRGIL